jgi:hypothetical protein
LLDPNPGPLTCIEEPETGLHPDALAIVGDALREASTRTQLIVTTHSDALVDRFTDEPENVVVCERDFDEGTTFRRLSREKLKEWLDEYTLGELWRRGEIGGKAEVLNRLKGATRNTGKGEYHKVRHAPYLLEKLDSSQVRDRAAHRRQLFEAVTAKLSQA